MKKLLLLLLLIPNLVMGAEYYLTEEFKNPNPNSILTGFVSCGVMAETDGFNKRGLEVVGKILKEKFNFSLEKAGLLMHDAHLFNDTHLLGSGITKKRYWDANCETQINEAIKIFL